MTNLMSQPAAHLQRFRVYRHRHEAYTVDVLARNHVEAIKAAGGLPLAHWRPFFNEWSDERADRISYEDFEPPSLPASAWVAASETPTHRETALLAISPIQP